MADDCNALSLEEKHPIVLPNQHPVTEPLVLMYHEREGHMGCSQVLTAMYKQYWILNGRSAVNNILKSCVKCRYWKTFPNQQQVRNLPADQVIKSTPFKAVGTDLMGPLTVRIGRNSVKGYVCIFNCLATRAVHFEIVKLLTLMHLFKHLDDFAIAETLDNQMFTATTAEILLLLNVS